MAAGGGFAPRAAGIAASEIGVWIFSRISLPDPEPVKKSAWRPRHEPRHKEAFFFPRMFLAKEHVGTGNNQN